MVLRGFTWFHSLGLTWNSLGVTWPHFVPLGLTLSHWVSLELTWSHLLSLRLTWFHLVALGFTWSHSVSVVLTWFHSASLDLTWPYLHTSEPLRPLRITARMHQGQWHRGSQGARAHQPHSGTVPKTYQNAPAHTNGHTHIQRHYLLPLGFASSHWISLGLTCAPWNP